MFIFNGNMNLVRELEDILLPRHSEGAFWIFKYLEFNKIILRYQQYVLEVRHEETSDFQD